MHGISSFKTEYFAVADDDIKSPQKSFFVSAGIRLLEQPKKYKDCPNAL
jgi:hypothetical protein